MKILQIGPYPPPIGGWSFHIKLFQEYLDSRRVENKVLDIGSNRRRMDRECIPCAGLVAYLTTVLRYCCKKYCIYIHFQGNSIIGLCLTLAAQIVAICLLQRTVLSFHAGVIQQCFSNKLTLQKFMAKIAFHLSKGIICNSEPVRQEIIKLGVLGDKIAPIPCFSVQYVHYEYRMTQEEEEFLKAHSPILCSYLFFRDEYEPEALFTALVELRKSYPDIGLVVLGSAEGVADFLDEEVLEKLRQNLLLAGDKDHDNFLSILNSSDIFIRTPVSDGVCSSVMEALSLNIPVVASDNGTRPAEAILYTPGDSDDLVANVLETLANIDRLKQLLANMPKRDAMVEEYQFLLKNN